MDDFQLGLLILSGIAVVGIFGLGIAWLLATQKPVEIFNEETWEWTDWQGHPRTLTAYRKVSGSVSKEKVLKL